MEISSICFHEQHHYPTNSNNPANTSTVKVDDILCLLESEREARRLR